VTLDALESAGARRGESDTESDPETGLEDIPTAVAQAKSKVTGKGAQPPLRSVV